WLEGGSSRAAAGLVRGGPNVIVTTMGVIRFRAETKLPYLESFHPGLTALAVAAETEFGLDVAGARETSPPSDEELRILREDVDPERVFLK
ncbi:MAG TPA: ketoacid-CoA transferase, partial [Acidobacteriota bacterium]|nr:ketoacid-CoA transferase [Acidobacteriota bacterium]